MLNFVSCARRSQDSFARKIRRRLYFTMERGVRRLSLAFRIAAIATGALLLLLAVAALFVYLKSERILHQTYDVPLQEITLPTDPASITEGGRLARIRGCYGGCHGKTLEGFVWEDSFITGHVVAPDLTRVVRELPPAVVARVVRHGVRENGESVWEMPSNMFFHLSDADMARIIAFLRSEAPRNGMRRKLNYGPQQRWEIVSGKLRSVRDEILAMGAPEREYDAGDSVAHGRYLARTVCSECHGMTLQGGSEGTPNLHVMAGAYPIEQFTTLMRTGKAAGDRELQLMSNVARSRFSHFTEIEIAALYTFLRSQPR